MPGGGQGHVFAGEALVVAAELGNVQGQVFFGGINMVGGAVIVYVEGHVSGHLPALNITAHKEAFFHGFVPVGGPPLQGVFSRHGLLPFCLKVLRPDAGIGP
ncbi:hypothetical protein D9M69_552050 [compost metagenome]